MPMIASILAIGSELTTGQIINKNGPWISQRLQAFGVQVSMHLTIPDDRELILQSLKYLSSNSDLIFVTGGLGPTSDDFTRDLIAAWTDTEMIFDEASWHQIQERLTSRGFTVQDIQKQQCYFPKDAKILINTQGTANGFFLEMLQDSKIKKVFVLPGPPKEIATLWQDHIASWLDKNTKNIEKLMTRSWDTMGVGESDVALIVEDILQHASLSIKITAGYRVHLPYVEVKLTFLESESKNLQNLLAKIDLALKKITVVKDFKDLAEVVVSLTKEVDFTFYDYISNGYLHSRFGNHLKNIPNWSWKQSSANVSVDLFTDEENFLALIPFEDEKCLILYEINGQRHQTIIEAPMKSSLMKERRRQYQAEMALAYFCKSYH